MIELKALALQITAQLPEDRDRALAVIGMVHDLLDWRGYSGDPDNSELTSLAGTDEISPQ